MKEAYRRW